MPGKFEGNSDEALAERLHARSLDGTWQMLGEFDGFGWYGLIADQALVVIDGQEAELVDTDWYILNEDSQGFVTIIEGPMSQEESEREWEALKDEYSRWHQEGD